MPLAFCFVSRSSGFCSRRRSAPQKPIRPYPAAATIDTDLVQVVVPAAPSGPNAVLNDDDGGLCRVPARTGMSALGHTYSPPLWRFVGISTEDDFRTPASRQRSTVFGSCSHYRYQLVDCHDRQRHPMQSGDSLHSLEFQIVSILMWPIQLNRIRHNRPLSLRAAHAGTSCFGIWPGSQGSILGDVQLQTDMGAGLRRFHRGLLQTISGSCPVWVAPPASSGRTCRSCELSEPLPSCRTDAPSVDTCFQRATTAKRSLADPQTTVVGKRPRLPILAKPVYHNDTTLKAVVLQQLWRFS